MAEIVDFLCRGRLTAAEVVALFFRGCRCGVQARNLVGEVRMGAERVQQNPVGARIEQAAIIGLTMHFEKRRADLPRKADANRRIIDESPAAPIGGHRAAQNDLAGIVAELASLQERTCRVVGFHIENGDDGALLRSGADHGAPGAPFAGCQAQRIQQNGFAGARLARQHVQARREMKLRSFDQNDVADGERGQHALGPRPSFRIPSGRLC